MLDPIGRLVNRTKFIYNLIPEVYTSASGDKPWIAFDMGVMRNVRHTYLHTRSTLTYVE